MGMKGLVFTETGLTDLQRDFATLVAKGLRPRHAAKAAGYDDPGKAAFDNMRMEKVIDFIQRARISEIQGNLAQTALSTMNNLMIDPTTPAPTRFQVSKWILEEAGHNQAQKAADMAHAKPMEEMSAAELAFAVANGMQALQDIAGQLNGSNILDGELVPFKDVDQDDSMDFLD